MVTSLARAAAAAHPLPCACALGLALAIVLLLTASVAPRPSCADEGPRAKPPVRVSASSVEFVTLVSLDLTPEGWMLVTDVSARAVHLLDEDGNLLLSFRAPQYADFLPADAAQGPDGFFYVTYEAGARLLAFGLDGKLAKEVPLRWADGSDVHPTAVASGPDGMLYVSDAPAMRIGLFDVTGKEARRLDLGSRVTRGMARAAVAADGRVCVLTTCRDVDFFDAKGKLEATRPVSGELSDMTFASGIAFDAQGTLYLVHHEVKEGGWLQTRDAAGARKSLVRLSAPVHTPTDVVVTSDGWVLVACQTGRILRLDREGHVVQVIGSPAGK
ncbi:MAG: hypothetical protein HYZ53_21015 [Planctomycetes bacterium]|nr:hypothetical protein [Planctomycetota bacterium]